MNQYGELARRYWARWHAGQYAIIRDPDEFFTVFAEMITDETDDLAGDDPPGEGYLAKVAQLEVAHVSAEELVLLPYRHSPADGGSGQA